MINVNITEYMATRYGRHATVMIVWRKRTARLGTPSENNHLVNDIYDNVIKFVQPQKQTFVDNTY